MSTVPRRGVHPFAENEYMPEEDSYARSNFYTISEDHRGHDKQAPRFRVLGSINARVAQLVQSGEFPAYRSVADVWRDAMVHRLKDLEGYTKDARMKDALRKTVQQARMTSEIRATLQAGKDAEEMLSLLDQLVSRHDLYDRTFLRERLSEYMGKAEEFDEPLRSKLVGKIKLHLDRL